MRLMTAMSMVLLTLPGWAGAAAAPPAPPPLSAAPPAFTAAQVEAGRTLYSRQCAACHGAAQEGGEAGPARRGTAFLAKWGPKPWQELYEQTRRTMPVTQPAGLARSQYGRPRR
ncbi:MAG: cytochrome c [Proteobacteria bacterium]|nr:cytochrome c [Pseudomonadota bacterium]